VRRSTCVCGATSFLTDDADVSRFEAAIGLQHGYGIESRILTPKEAQLGVDDVVAAAFCPVAGYVTPESVVQGYVRRAVELGADVEQSCPVTRIVVRDGCVVGVETPRGAIRTERVICAAGVWSRELVASVGIDLPVEPEGAGCSSPKLPPTSRLRSR
jgi:sarcosine oxidase subunit beta